jgi:hypothetical protein
VSHIIRRIQARKTGVTTSDQVTESRREMQGGESWIAGDNDTTNSRHQSLSLDGLVYTFFV